MYKEELKRGKGDKVFKDYLKNNIDFWNMELKEH